jgi:hypothetical protein
VAARLAVVAVVRTDLRADVMVPLAPAVAARAVDVAPFLTLRAVSIAPSVAAELEARTLLARLRATLEPVGETFGASL